MDGKQDSMIDKERDGIYYLDHGLKPFEDQGYP